MQLITFIPASDEDLEYNLKKVITAIAGPLDAKMSTLQKLIPGFIWGAKSCYEQVIKEEINEYMNEVKTRKVDNPFSFKIGGLGIVFYDPSKYNEIKKDFAKGLYDSELRFISSPVRGKFYFVHPVYFMLCPLDDYYRFIFLEKLYFWRKILIEIGAKTIKINVATENTRAFFYGFAEGLFFDELSGQHGDSKEQRNMSLIERNLIFSQANNELDEKYINIREEDFDENGKYTFKKHINIREKDFNKFLHEHEEQLLEILKLKAWIYDDDDRELRHIFETRLSQLLTKKQGNLDFYVKCNFKDISMTKKDEEFLSDLGFMKTQLSSINKNELFLELKVSF